MGFFAEVSAWLNAVLTGYIGTTTALVAAALEPAVVTLAVVYVIGWGYLQASGQIQEPFADGLQRMARIALVVGAGLHLWLYNSVVVDSFFNAPAALAAAVVGSPDSVTVVDQIIFSGGDAAAALMQKGGVLSGNLSFYLAGFFVYAAVGIAAIYTIFLLCLSKVALSVLLALGPFFIATLLFRAARRLFDAWIAQLANYGLIAVLATLLVALLMRLLTSAADAAAARATAITIADGVRVCFCSGLVFLVLRQVMPMASGLAQSVALSSYGAVSQGAKWALQSRI